jgi:hypothetical protein
VKHDLRYFKGVFLFVFSMHLLWLFFVLKIVVLLLFSGVGLFKNVFEKGKRRTQFRIPGSKQLVSSLSPFSFNRKSPLRERMRSSNVLREGFQPIKSPFDNYMYLFFTYPWKENSGQIFMSLLGGERPRPGTVQKRYEPSGKTGHIAAVGSVRALFARLPPLSL